MQFQGQSHLLNIPLDTSEPTLELLAKAFESAYWNRFEVALPEIRPVLVNVHTAVLGKRPAVQLRHLAGDQSDQGDSSKPRDVWFQSGVVTTPVLARTSLAIDGELAGPMIIEQLDTTTVLPPDCKVTTDASGNLIITVAAQ